jgi:predicted phage replisome organizer
MAEVKWIKLTTDMFDNRKIKHLRRLPDGDSIVLIWVMLLTMAGRCNSGGMIFLTENIPYTPKMLADELDFEENTVILALKALEDLSMIVTNGNYFAIAGWEEYQNIEGMDRIREQNRLAQQRSRARRKQLQGGQEEMSCDSHVTVTQCHATDKEEDKEKEIDKKKKRVKENNHTLFSRIRNDYIFDEEIADKLTEWFAYKTARNDSYTEPGMKVLLRKIENSCIQYGVQAVCDLIDESMANNWKGIIFDRLKTVAPSKKTSSYTDSIKSRVSDVDNW